MNFVQGFNVADSSRSNVYGNLEFTDNAYGRNTDILIMHENIRSVRKNFDNLLCHLATYQLSPALLFLTEIFIKEHELAAHNINKYRFFANCNSENKNAGVAVYVSDDVRIDRVCNLNFRSADSIMVTCCVGNEVFTFVCLYRLHEFPVATFLAELSSILSIIKTQNLVLLGDINLDLLIETNHTREYLSILSTIGLECFVSEPTRFSEEVASCLDHLFLRSKITSTLQFRSTLFDFDITDHVIVALYIQPCDSACTVQPVTKVISKLDYCKLFQNLANVCWDDIFLISDVNTAYLHFISKLKSVIERSTTCFSNQGTNKSCHKEWITNNLREKIIMKNELGLLHRKHPSNIPLKERYLSLKKKLAKQVRCAKLNYYDCKFNQARDSKKEQWRLINEITGVTRKSTNISGVFDANKNFCSDERHIANTFNSYFASIPVELKNKYIELYTYTSLEEKLFSNSNKSQSSSVFLWPVTEAELDALIQDLKSSNSKGIDDLTNNIVKRVTGFVVKPLTYIYNLSLTTGVFPDAFKCALVIPLYKNGDRTNMENYRPISLLPVFSKLLEKVIKARLLSFFKRTSFLSARQYGYLNNVNTEDALLNFFNYIYDGVNANMKNVGLFIDITKAFDTVQHNILLEKLRCAGVRGISLSWFESYLSNRSQRVKINGQLSDICLLGVGVPQGSVLGPILFLVYINSLCELNLHGKLTAFADDAGLCYSGKNLALLEEFISEDLLVIRKWFNFHSIVLSKKSKFMVFSIKVDHNIDDSFPNVLRYHSLYCNSISCNSLCVDITRTDEYKYLGVVVDRYLKFDKHIDKIRKELMFSISKLYTLRHFCSFPIVRSVYFSFFHSRLEYGISIWGGTYFNHLRHLCTLQKFALRVMFFVPLLTPSRPLFQKANILPLRYVFVYKVLRIFYKRAGYSVVRSVTEYNLRINNLCLVPFTRKECYRRTYRFVAPYFFNILPSDLKNSVSLDSFCGKLRRWLFDIADIESYF